MGNISKFRSLRVTTVGWIRYIILNATGTFVYTYVWYAFPLGMASLLGFGHCLGLTFFVGYGLQR
jgi:hypothetical protein